MLRLKVWNSWPTASPSNKPKVALNMSETAASQRTKYPLAAYNFKVTIGETTMGFTEVTGLVREYQKLTYQHGLSFWEGEAITKFRYDKYSEIVLKKGLIAGASQLYQWLDSVDKKFISVSLCDEKGVPVVIWKIQKALVIKIEAPTLQANSNEAAIDTLTLMASGISVEHQ
jgi:phage tail-like protein